MTGLDDFHYHRRYDREPTHVYRGEWRGVDIRLWQDQSGKWTVRVFNEDFAGNLDRNIAIDVARARIDALVPRTVEKSLEQE